MTSFLTDWVPSAKAPEKPTMVNPVNLIIQHVGIRQKIVTVGTYTSWTFNIMGDETLTR